MTPLTASSAALVCYVQRCNRVNVKTHRRGKAAGFESRCGRRGWGSRGSVGVRESRERTWDGLQNWRLFLEEPSEVYFRRSANVTATFVTWIPFFFFQVEGGFPNGNLNKQSEVALHHVWFPAFPSLFPCLSLCLCVCVWELAKGSVA